MEDEFVETSATTSSPFHHIEILPKGIEKLHQDGYETILDNDARYEILDVLYQKSREDPRRPFVSREDLIDTVAFDEEEIDQNIWYLKEKRLVEHEGGMSGNLFRRVKNTKHGSEQYESYKEDGVEIPSSLGVTSIRQASIGPGESDKAENLFRDFVELAETRLLLLIGILEIRPTIF